MNDLMLKPFQPRGNPGGSKFVLTALEFLGVTGDQIDILGLREIKKLAKEGYAECLYQIHPDRGGKGFLYRYQRLDRYKGGEGERVYIRHIKRMFERISRLKYKPMTIANCEQVLRISKGYKTTEDIDLGLNGCA